MDYPDFDDAMAHAGFRKKIVHKGGKVSPSGQVSALCFEQPKAIDLFCDKFGDVCYLPACAAHGCMGRESQS